MNGEVFPGMDDTPFEQHRADELCGRIKKRVYVSSSNVAAILYRIPKRGDGFKLTVKFTRHPSRKYQIKVHITN